MTRPASRIRRAHSTQLPDAPRRRLGKSRWAAAAPALFVIAGVLLFGIAAWAQSSDGIVARYQHDAESAIQADDFETARVCYERLLQPTPNDPALLFGLARSLAGLHHPVDAFQIIQRLAPADAAGYAPAQVVVAEQILTAPPDAKSLELARVHAQRALESDPNNAQALLLLNRIYAQTPAR